ncbi:MAG: hypothetical protein J5833_05305, partial [Victivallales bacterium]|nr:hypothetical protein [Victivallales bacterium]
LAMVSPAPLLSMHDRKRMGIRKMKTLITALLFGAAALMAQNNVAPFVPKGENVALKKPYSFSASPSYWLCTDPDDRTQLTDGVYTNGYFWTQKSTVGWNSRNAVLITIDLGETFPIGGFSYNTAFGVAGVTMPEFIYVYVSEDKNDWQFVGDLFGKSVAERGMPEKNTYMTYKAASNSMPCKGRHVCFVVKQNPLSFVDEIEVLKGDDSLLANAPSLERTSSPMIHFYGKLLQSFVENDIRLLERRIEKLKPSARTAIAADIAEYRRSQLVRMAVGSYDFTPIYPFDDVHRAFFAINAKYLRAEGFARPLIWRSCRWDNTEPTAVPPTKGAAEPVEIEMMRGEVRSESINILNPTDEPLTFKVEVQGLPEGSGIDCREVIGLLVNPMKYSSSALRPGDGASITVEVPSGMSKQIWLSFRRPTLKAGLYKATVSATAGKVSLKVPLKLRIYDFDFPKEPRLHVGGWDYLNGSGDYYCGKNCIDASIEMMKGFYTDSPWATATVMPSGAKFDADGKILNPKELDMRQWDIWTKRWSGARLYCVFNAVGRAFQGEPMGTPRFTRMVDGYYNAGAALLKERGIDTSRVILLLVDEPMSKEHDERVVAWSKALRASKSGFVIFEDPIWQKPEQGSPEMYMASDILCPNTVMMAGADNPEAFRRFFTDYRDKGITLWLYSCIGPSRLLDPITYHRGQEWRAFEMGAEGSFYWALGCGGGIGDSWHPFRQTGTEFSPFMVSPDKGPMEAKQSEGIREGVQDYEYLCMLRDRIAELKKAGGNAKKIAAAEKLLAEAPMRALRMTPVPGAPKWSKKSGMYWYDEKDRTYMDAESRKILRMLDALK